MTSSSRRMLEAVVAFLNADTWVESKRIVEAHRELLLTDDVDAALRYLMYQHSEDADAMRILQQHQQLLTRCRKEGIDAAFSELLSPAEADEAGSDPLFVAIRALLTAGDLDEIKRLIEQHADLLLTDAADAEIERLLVPYRADAGGDRNDEAVQQLQAHRALLKRCRAEGIDAAFAELPPVPAALTDAVLAFFNARTWAESKQAVEKHADVLLTDEIGPVWESLLRQCAGNAEAIRHIEEHRNLLIRCRQEGIDVAFANRLTPSQRAIRSLTDLVLAFVNARTWEESKQVVQENADALLSEQTDSVLQGLLEQYSEDSNVLRRLEDNRDLLARCRREGIDAAFADRVPRAELQVLLAELPQLTQPSHMSRRVQVCREAVSLVDRRAEPERWAYLQVELADSLAQDPLGERAQNLEEAIRCYVRALEVRTREAFPVDWATTQNNLGNTYRNRILGERAENIELAIGCYRRALEVRAPTTLPQDCRDTAYLLGWVLHAERRFGEARDALVTAHQAIEALHGEASRESARRRLSEENADLYARLVHSCIVEGDEEAAFAYAVAGKGRAFVDLLSSARLNLSAAGADDPALADDLRRAEELRRQIETLRARLNAGGDTATEQDRRAVRQTHVRLRALQAEDAALWEELAYKYPGLTATQQAPPFSAADARALALELGAVLVELYEHAGGWSAFVVTPDIVKHVSLPAVNNDLLKSMFQWRRWLRGPTLRGSGSYSPLYDLYDAVIVPLRPYLPTGGRAVLASFSWLHLLPLGAARDRHTGRYASDEYTLSFAPSLAAIKVAREQASRTAVSSDVQDGERLLGVAYPGRGTPGTKGYLHNVLPELEAVESYFEHVTPLHMEDATAAAVIENARGHDVLHLGCHGLFDVGAPSHSGLMLAEDSWLTVQQIITRLHLDRARLAVLSACQTGQLDVRRGEEHVGLVQAMMTAGARTVVASLWSVDDASTRLLFEEFYAGLAEGRSPAEALARATGRVREHPGWHHPYYWAAFQAVGLAQTPPPHNTRSAGSTTVGRAPNEAVIVRGEEAMQEADAGEIIETAVMSLEQLNASRDEVVRRMNPPEREHLTERLESLSAQADAVGDDADLLEVAAEVQRLVDETPSLAAFFAGGDDGGARLLITQQIHDAAQGESQYIEAYLPGLKNHIVTLMRTARLGGGKDKATSEKDVAVRDTAGSD
ncbi:MAG: CHAT domain-containing protein [Chloroflexota bacterium]|nr:CHAT domain-containing protein [Chloroflexota bacterium]